MCVADGQPHRHYLGPVRPVDGRRNRHLPGLRTTALRAGQARGHGQREQDLGGLQTSALCLDRRLRARYCPISRCYESQGGWRYDRRIRPRRDGVAGQEAPALADGADRPDAAHRRPADRVGDEPVRLARRIPGAVLDRPDPAVRRAAGA